MMSSLNALSVHDTGQRKSHALMSVLQAGENDDSGVHLLVDRIVEIAEEVLDSQLVLLFFVGTAPDLFTLSSPSSSHPHPLTLPLDRGIPGYVARTGRPHNTPHAASDPHHDPSTDALLGVTTHTSLCFPIVNSAGTVYAVLQAINKRRPGQDDEDDDALPAPLPPPSSSPPDLCPDYPPYTEDDEEIGTAFCVGVGSTLRRRLTEVVMWRSQRRGEGDDKGIQSMLEIYGNSGHPSSRSSQQTLGGYDRGGSGGEGRGKRRSLGASSFTSAMLASIYSPIPEPSHLQPSLSDGHPLADSRRATWSRTMSMPFKGRRVPISHLDLSHTTDLSVIGLAAGQGAGEGAGGEAGEAGGGGRQGSGPSAYTVLPKAAWMSSPRGSRKGGLVLSHSTSALYSTLPSSPRTAPPHILQPHSSSITTYSPASQARGSGLGAGFSPVLSSTGGAGQASAFPFSPFPPPAFPPPAGSPPVQSPALTAYSASAATHISFSSTPASPSFPPLGERAVAPPYPPGTAASPHVSPPFHPSATSSSLSFVTFSALSYSPPSSSPPQGPIAPSSTSTFISPSRLSSYASRFAAPWAAFDSARDEEGDGPLQAITAMTSSSTGSSPGFTSSQSMEAGELRASFSLSSPPPLADGLGDSTTSLPPLLKETEEGEGGEGREGQTDGYQRVPSEGGSGVVDGPSASPLLSRSQSYSLSSSALVRGLPAVALVWPSLPGSVLPDLEALSSLSFNPFDYSDDALLHCCLLMLQALDLTRHFGLSLPTLQSFLLAVRSRYRQNPYHNFYHATSVMQFAYFTVRCTEAGVGLPKLDLLALLLAALCHDIDHPGTTNSFQVMAASDLALLYNDQAVLESHHARHHLLPPVASFDVHLLAPALEAAPAGGAVGA